MSMDFHGGGDSGGFAKCHANFNSHKTKFWFQVLNILPPALEIMYIGGNTQELGDGLPG